MGGVAHIIMYIATQFFWSLLYIVKFHVFPRGGDQFEKFYPNWCGGASLDFDFLGGKAKGPKKCLSVWEGV